MNEPVINPLWIYLVSVLPEIKKIADDLTFCISLFLACSIVMYIRWRAADYTPNCEASIDMKNTWEKYNKLGGVIIVLGCALTVLIPSEKTIYTMMGASYLTPQNIQIVGDGAKDVVDYFFDQVDQIVNGDDENENSD